MSEALDDDNIFETLSAFADGELDAAGSLAALDYLVEHPEWLAVLRDHQRLRLEAHRVVHANTPAIGADFRSRLVALAGESTDAEGQPPRSMASADVSADARPAGLRRVAWWPAVAAAAALIVGVTVGRVLLPRHVEVAVHEPETNGIPPTLIAAVTKVHVDCSRFDLSDHDGPFPTAEPMAALATDVRESFHTQVPYPDLRSIGYEFVGAGPCKKPLENTVHLLYRATAPDHRETLSILVQPYHGQVQIPARQFTLATGGNQPHPSYVWRTDVAVYIVVSDDAGTADRARDALQLATAR